MFKKLIIVKEEKNNNTYTRFLQNFRLFASLESSTFFELAIDGSK